MTVTAFHSLVTLNLNGQREHMTLNTLRTAWGWQAGEEQDPGESRQEAKLLQGATEKIPSRLLGLMLIFQSQCLPC